MLGLCSQMVVTFRKVIEVIKDPFMKFTEFALRANIYRNIVLAIEVLLLLFRKNLLLFLKTMTSSIEIASILTINILV